MRTTRFLGTCLLAASASCLSLRFANAAEVSLMVSGEVVDLACYLGHGGKGLEHQKCAQKCAQMGQPMGLLASDGSLYLLVADHSDPAPYGKARSLAGEQVEIKGEVSEKSGMKSLTVDEVKKK